MKLASFATSIASMSVCLFKEVVEILPKRPSHMVGDGFLVFPVFADKAFTNDISPFLMFDYGAPRYVEPSKKSKGVGEHPHRGFETVTIAFQGEVEHKDSNGGTGKISGGDVQWMTAGSGVIHEEYMSKEFTQKGGTIEMCQLWVNLPAKHKMTKPNYQEILAKTIPSHILPNNAGNIRVISGKYQEAVGPATTFSPVHVYDMNLNKNIPVTLKINEKYNSMLFVRRGCITIGEDKKRLDLHHVAILSRDGDSILVEALEDNTSVVVLSGEPLNEPIAHHGPFVMNTRDELMTAFHEFQTGRFIK